MCFCPDCTGDLLAWAAYLDSEQTRWEYEPKDGEGV